MAVNMICACKGDLIDESEGCKRDVRAIASENKLVITKLFVMLLNLYIQCFWYLMFQAVWIVYSTHVVFVPRTLLYEKNLAFHAKAQKIGRELMKKITIGV